MAIVHRDRQLVDWPAFALPERWRRLFETDLEQEGWLRTEEYTDGDTLVLKVEAPGIDPDKDVEVTAASGMLRVTVHREEREEDKRKSGYRSEFRYGELTRSMRLPENVSSDDVTASYRDGILEVRVPVPPEKQAEPKTIPVNRG